MGGGGHEGGGMGDCMLDIEVYGFEGGGGMWAGVGG